LTDEERTWGPREGDEIALDRHLRVPSRRFALLWSVVAIGSVVGKLLASELGAAWLTAPVLLSVAVTVGLIGMLVLIRRQEASAAARWPLGEERRAAAPWN
jgi:hypothetical protein